MINENELDSWILGKLSSGPLTHDYLMQGLIDVMDSVAVVAMRGAIVRLRMAGKIRSNPDGAWKLRTRPDVVMETPGDPDFRSGGKDGY